MTADERAAVECDNHRFAVSLRTHLERIIDEHDRLYGARFEASAMASEKDFAIVNQRFELADKALHLQAAEYDRRLTSLNHAHELAIKEQQRTVPRETYDTFLKDYDRFRLETTNALTASTTRSITWTAAVGLFFVILTIALRFWKG